MARIRSDVIDQDNEHALQEYGARYGATKTEQLSDLMLALRVDWRQAELHRSWVLSAAEDSLKRIREFHRLPSGWFLLASDLWHVGKVYAAALHPDARGYFERALEIWETQGAEAPGSERQEAVSGLRGEIEKLAQNQSPKCCG